MSQKVTDITDRLEQQNIYIDTVIFGDPTPFSVTLAAGSRTSFVLGIQNTRNSGPEIYNMAMRTRVDTDDANHDWPTGSSLTAGQLASVFFPTGLWWNDLIEGTLENAGVNNVRYFAFVITNNDSSSHTFYTRLKFYHQRLVPSEA